MAAERVSSSHYPFSLMVIVRHINGPCKKKESIYLPRADSNYSSILHCSLNSYQEMAFLLPSYKRHLDFHLTYICRVLVPGLGRGAEGNKSCQKAFSGLSLKTIAQWASEQHLWNGLNVSQLGRERQPCHPPIPPFTQIILLKQITSSRTHVPVH